MRPKLLPILLLILCILLGSASRAQAVKIADITRLAGQRTNPLTGVGLIYGLKGTGDGGDFQPAMKPLAAMLGKFHDPTTTQDLTGVKNVALVALTVIIPKDGAAEGDALDVYVESLGPATSLKGGRLFLTTLHGPPPEQALFAMAQGPVVLEDPATPTAGVIKGGAVMEADWKMNYIEEGRLTLVLDDAAASTWTTASTIAKIINDAETVSGETLATVRDPRTVEVTIPPIERERPDSFISRVQRLPIPQLPTEAQVLINERTGTMVVTGDVEISPVVISHKGLTITTVLPPPVPTPRNPVTSSKDLVALDTSNQGGARLQDLVNALDQLKVPAEERITIIKELHKTGKLHAKLIVSGG